MMRFGRFFFAFACILGLTLPALKAQVFRGLPFIQTFGTSDYQAGIQNWDIAQNKRGFLYFANNFGLLEYDGHHWKVFGVKAGSKVRCLSIGQDGRIFVGSQGEFGVFSPSPSGEWTYSSLAESLPQKDRNFDEVWRIYQFQDKVYFCTFQKIFVYDGEKIKVLQPRNPIEFSFLAHNRLYVQDWEKGLTFLDGDQLQQLPEGDFFSRKRIVSILPYDQQQILIVTQQDGLFLYNGLQLRKLEPGLFPSLSRLMLSCAIRLNNGSFVLGSQSNGLYLMNHQLELQQKIDKQQGLNDHTIVSLFEDRHHNLWVGHNHGISYVELSSPFTLLDEKIKVPGSGYAAALHHDTLYLGTNNGLYAGALQGGSGLGFEQLKNTQGQVYHISHQGTSLLMGHHNGAFRIQDRQAQPLRQQSGVWQFKRLQRNPELMLGGSYHGFSLYGLEDHKWEWKHHISGFDESSRIFEEDSQGNIWMAHGYKGIYKLSFDHAKGKFEAIRHYGKKDGLPSDVLNNLYKVNNKLVFTGETGVYRYHPGEDHFYPDTSLTNVLGRGEHIQKLQQDANGKIYFIGKSKLGSIQPLGFGKWEADTSRFNKVHKLLNDDLDFLAVLNNQNILFGAKEGFIHFDPGLPIPEPGPFQVYIRKVAINTPSDSVLFGGNFWFDKQMVAHQPENDIKKLPYASNSIRFEFSAPYFDGTEHLNYQYLLENFDQKWSNWSGETTKEYTNLPEGTYTFRVRGRNIYGELSQEESYQFKIMPPWYRAPWAYLGYSFSAIGMLLVGMFFVNRKHRREKELLTVKQQKALNQKKRELENLSKTSEEEINRLQHEKLESEIRHKNKELATSTMHIVSKNEFIGEIKQHLNSIMKEKPVRGVSKELNKIIKEIDQNIATDKDWEQFQIHFDRVHGDFSKRIKAAYPNLSPQEMKLCAYLRLNLSTKEIAQLMHISVRGVEISRYRLRKKLELERQDNLLDFILNL